MASSRHIFLQKRANEIIAPLEFFPAVRIGKIAATAIVSVSSLLNVHGTQYSPRSHPSMGHIREELDMLVNLEIGHESLASLHVLMHGREDAEGDCDGIRIFRGEERRVCPCSSDKRCAVTGLDCNDLLKPAFSILASRLIYADPSPGKSRWTTASGVSSSPRSSVRIPDTKRTLYPQQKPSAAHFEILPPLLSVISFTIPGSAPAASGIDAGPWIKALNNFIFSGVSGGTQECSATSPFKKSGM
jgi:hypothetical protein